MSVKIINSKFKKLIVSGCSFTHNRLGPSHAWANLLADWAGMEIVNLASPGAGNGHIANSLVLYLEKNTPDPLTTLVMAMWSGLNRFDLIVDNNKCGETWALDYYYDQFNRHTVAHHTQLNQQINNIKSNKTMTLEGWLNFNMLTNYLNLKNYNYRYTTFTDILNKGNQSGNVNFLKELATLKLTLDCKNWILINNLDPLGEFALYHNEEIPNDGHPTLNGHERWVKEKLIPKLIDENILYQ